MLKWVSYVWRWLFSLIAYIIYGLFSLIAGLLFFIPFLLLPKKISKKISQFLMYLSYYVLTKFLIITGVMSVQIIDKSYLKNLNGTLIISNHPSFLDIVVLMSILPKADCIVKASLRSNFIIGWFVRASQYIVSDNPLQLVETCIDRLNEGFNIIIFPEGTRSKPTTINDFQRAYASIAINSACNLIPIFVTCTPPALTKQSRWYAIPERKFQFDIKIFPPIDMQKFIESSKEINQSSKVFSKKMEDFFKSLMNSEPQNHNHLFQLYFPENS